MNQEIYEKLKQITDEEAEILKGRQEVDMGRYVKPIEAGLSGGYVGMPDLDSSKLLESGKLIQTGTTNWMADVLVRAGGVLLAAGYLLERKRKSMFHKAQH